LKSVNLTLLPTPLIAFAYILAASSLYFSLFAPVITIFPFLKISAVVLAGSLNLIINAANLFGLY
jgi:hypothetical protein